ncbi:hypothetical protein NAA61_04375 [Listeria monocytogenes]|uniref:hypothetical protein n=1 Tax=Listeria monocytogenes TaxID=1639 RepID=UPI000EDE81F7|nr:hypothetical protein [Listeria monocytogenes]EAA0137937.1 hypothetical protein [Listeria monocytogenes]EAC4973854.1 hypothetical protein [Listeria monocytogenes]EAC7573731.1 hypothetical protein [Listeria monocytogenes]EAC7610434.1 hypothetical protein [Listeria monocytogenes]EAD8656643.1 hypothetical protein [Listeria monocytogenes]
MNEQEAKAIVLEWLKDNSKYYSPRDLFFELERRGTNIVPSNVAHAYDTLSVKAEYELLAEFAAWGLKEGAK